MYVCSDSDSKAVVRWEGRRDVEMEGVVDAACLSVKLRIGIGIGIR